MPGGRKHAYLTPEIEEALIQMFLKFDMKGFIIAYQRKVGRFVSQSTVYRVIQRHGVSKYLPRCRTPKRFLSKKEFKQKEQKFLT